MAPHSKTPQSAYSEPIMSVLSCWNLDIKQATIRKAAPIENGTGKTELVAKVEESVAFVAEGLSGEYTQVV